MALTLAASSFRDGTRVAGTEPALVRAMCENNRAALVTALDETLELLREAREELANPDKDMKGLTEVGHAARGRFEARAGRKARGKPTDHSCAAGWPGLGGAAGIGGIDGRADRDLLNPEHAKPRPVLYRPG